jgi:hypothetical protein
LHSYNQGYHRSERLRNRHDAEVIGQVVTLARKLTCPPLTSTGGNANDSQ